MMSGPAVAKRVVDNVAHAIDLAEIQSRNDAKQILLCDPTHFDVKDAKNPFMEGNENKVDRNLAQAQWKAVKDIYESLGAKVHVVAGVEDFEDMVFTANQVLPFLGQNGKPQVLLAEMRHPSRQREVPYFATWFEQNGYALHQLPAEISKAGFKFEGQGDAIWHPGKNLLWGGFGQRTDEPVYENVAQIVNAPVVKLRLAHPRFYHLDTCFCVLDEKSVMIFPAAFDKAGLDLIHHYFESVIEVTESEANNFVCNSVVLERKILIQKGSPDASKKLQALGYDVIEIDVSEFMKSGGGVFCLKMMVY